MRRVFPRNPTVADAPTFSVDMKTWPEERRKIIAAACEYVAAVAREDIDERSTGGVNDALLEALTDWASRLKPDQWNQRPSFMGQWIEPTGQAPFEIRYR